MTTLELTERELLMLKILVLDALEIEGRIEPSPSGAINSLLSKLGIK